MSTLNRAAGLEATEVAAPVSVPVSPPVSFTGRDRVHATRVALDFWFQHRASLKLSVRAFLSKCQLSSDERTVIFQGALRGPMPG